jgi:hypothetical protein
MPRQDKESDWGDEDDEDTRKGKKKRRDWQRKGKNQEGEEDAQLEGQPQWPEGRGRR